MYYIEPLEQSDLNECYKLSCISGTGMTSFPQNKELLSKIIHETTMNIQLIQLGKQPVGMIMLGMKKIDDNKLVGVSALKYHGNKHCPFDYELTETCLRRRESTQQTVELCAILLAKELRSKGLGKFLSLSRFIFLKRTSSKNRYTVCARLRGLLSNIDNNIIWEHIGQKYTGLTLGQAIEHRENENDDIFNTIPLEIPLKSIPGDCVPYLKQCHPDSYPAYQILMRCGFKGGNCVDILDGGPNIFTSLNELQIIQDVQQMSITHSNHVSMDNYTHFIVSQNKKKQFLMVLCPGEVNDSRLHIKKDLYDYWEFESNKKYFILETNKRYANRTI
jgi:arginine N-succinyltransferase